MNTTLIINTLETNIVKMKDQVLALTHSLDLALQEVKSIKDSIDPQNMYEGVPTSNLTIITKDELEIKKNEDYFKGSKVLVDKTNSDFSTLPLIATDGSLVQSRSRRIAAAATIFSEDSLLNSTKLCPDSTSSTGPEIWAIFEAIDTMTNIGLTTAVITSDSVAAINYSYDLLHAPAHTKNTEKINSNSPNVKTTSMSIKEKCSKLNYLILVHTKSHQDTGYDYFSRLNSIADKNAKCLARNTLMNLLPRNLNNEREQDPNNTQSNSHSTSQTSHGS